jgi:nucleotide-binding universal stress UspA family protein
VELARRTLIVVGIDGSANSAEALKWAVAEAVRRGRAYVHAVHCWSRSMPDTDDQAAEVPGRDRDWLAGGMTLSKTVVRVATPTCPVRIRQILLQGSPAPLLAERAAGADLLVLGSRSHPGEGIDAGALDGPTSLDCRRRVACQVMVVPPPCVRNPVG